MKYLLDTNLCIVVMNGRSERAVARLESTDPGEIAVSSVTRGELLYGARHSSRPAERVADVTEFLGPYASYAFDDACAHHYSVIRNELARLGTPIGPNDLMIAATALAHDLTVVTPNTREFSRVVGLRVEDWE